LGKIKIALNNFIAGAGKSTIANYLESEYGFKQYALADGIYEIAYRYFDIPRGTKPPRKLLHHIGESLRQYDKLLWIKYTLNRIEQDNHNRVVITDVRKLLEHAYLLEHGWDHLMVYCEPEIALQRLIKRDGRENVDKELVINSPLENQLRSLLESNTMKIIDNTGDWNEVRKSIDRYIQELINKNQK